MKLSEMESHAENPQVDLAQEDLVRYWSDRFRCTPSDLLAVVGRVGRSVKDIEAEIARRISVKDRAAVP